MKVARQILEAADILRNKNTGCRFNEVHSIAICSVLDGVILELTEDLQTFIEFKAVTENFHDFKVIFIDGKRDTGAAL